jgi:hypothetical protein
MKAEIVYNKSNHPRLLLTFETDEERTFFDDEPDLLMTRRGETNDVLADMSYRRDPTRKDNNE